MENGVCNVLEDLVDPEESGGVCVCVCVCVWKVEDGKNRTQINKPSYQNYNPPEII